MAFEAQLSFWYGLDARRCFAGSPVLYKVRSATCVVLPGPKAQQRHRCIKQNLHGFTGSVFAILGNHDVS